MKTLKFVLLFSIVGLVACNHTQKSCCKVKANDTLQVISSKPSLVGEGAWWDSKSQQLYTIDIDGKKLFISTSDSGIVQTFDLTKRPGTIVPTQKGNVVLALEDSIVIYNISQKKIIKTLAALPINTKEIRFNDGKCDSKGRLWVGTMDCKEYNKPVGCLYKVDGNGTITVMLKQIAISNGIIWNKENTKMYYIDTPTRQVRAFDFNAELGTLSNERIVITIPDTMGTPDGCTIDVNGNLWIAIWDGGCVTYWNPNTGKLLEQIKLPALNITSVALGGVSMDTLFITSAAINTPDSLKAQYPWAGHTFKRKVNAKGFASNYFNE